MSNESVSSIVSEYPQKRVETQPINKRKPFQIRKPGDVDETLITSSFDELTKKIARIKAVQAKQITQGVEIETEKLLTEAKIGQKISGNYISCLEALGIGYDIKAKLTIRQIESINAMNKSLDTVLPKEDKRIQIVGLLGEYASYVAVTEAIKRGKLPLEVFKPSPAEDLTTGTDLILQRIDKPGIIPCQIKYTKLTSRDRLLHPISYDNRNELLARIMHNTPHESGERSYNRQRSLQGSFDRILSFNDPELPVTERVVLAIPSQGGKPLFDTFNGLPREKFIYQMQTELRDMTLDEEGYTAPSREKGNSNSNIGSIITATIPQQRRIYSFGSDD